jgi:hypothetical protein
MAVLKKFKRFLDSLKLKFNSLKDINLLKLIKKKKKTKIK